MGLTDKLQSKKEALEQEVRERVEEFNSLVRVYLQATMAVNLGIMDLRMLPDLKLLKQKFKIPTEGKLGVAEKKYVRKLMMSEYKMTEVFFNEVDSSAKRVCKKQQDMPNYFYLFQGLSQSMFMSVANEMQWSLRLPAFFNGLIKRSAKDAIHKVLTSNDFKAADARQAAINTRSLKDKLNLSEEWMLQYMYPVLMLSKGAKVK